MKKERKRKEMEEIFWRSREKMDTGGKTEPNKKQVNRKPTNREEKV